MDSQKHKYLYIKFLTLALLLFCCFKTTIAQHEKDSLYILDAVILTNDSLLPIHNAHVISKFNRWGTISNKEGRFKLYVQNSDSILVTSIGFSPMILQIDTNILAYDSIVVIHLLKDTLTINEVVIRGYWDYTTMKQIIVDMKPIDLTQFYPDWTGTGLLYKQPGPASFKGPIQALYDVFNRSARLQRKLINNRKEYNKVMNQMGRSTETISIIPEHMQESPY